MCRFIAYIGQPIIMYDLLYRPKNSLINQSIRAHETEEPLNGDGFGVGWYMPTIDPTPALYVSVRPAWNDRNMKYIAPKIKANCIFAHVRAASTGEVNEMNCHPFHYRNFLFMHNGDIEGFEKIKRRIREQLRDEIYNHVHGQTDSEHLFALFLEIFEREEMEETAESIASAMEKAIKEVQKIKKKYKITDPSYINVAVSDGNSLIALRYLSNMDMDAPTLYYSEGTGYECVDGVCRMRRDVNERAVLVVSERLTSYRSDWKEIPVNHMLIVGKNLHTTIKPLKIPLDNPEKVVKPKSSNTRKSGKPDDPDQPSGVSYEEV